MKSVSQMSEKFKSLFAFKTSFSAPRIWPLSFFLLAGLVAILTFQNFSNPNTPAKPTDTCPPNSEGGYLITQIRPQISTNPNVDVSADFQAAINDTRVKTLCLPPRTYFIGRNIYMPKDKILILKGLDGANIARTLIQFKGKTIPFYSSSANGDQNKVRIFRAHNLTFDGSTTQSEFSNAKNATTRALSLIASDSANTSVEINNVHFKNMFNLPIWLEAFSSVRIVNSRFSKTKDPGILRSGAVVFSNNIVEDTYDNCVSISRGNSNVTVTYNTLNNCGGAGIFVGGIAYPGNRDLIPGEAPIYLTLNQPVGESTAPDSRCTITSSRNYFRDKFVGTMHTLEKSTNGSQDSFVIVEITKYISPTQVECKLKTTLQPGLKGNSTSTWIDGPHFAGENINVRYNIIRQSKQYGIKLSMGPKSVTVANNEIYDSGYYSDPFTKIKTKYDTIFGIAALGWFMGTEPNAYRYAENLQIRENQIYNPTFGGIRIGSDQTGNVRNSTIAFNEIDLSASNGSIGIYVDHTINMPPSGLIISQNRVSFSRGVANTYSVRTEIPSAFTCEVFWDLDVSTQNLATCGVFSSAENRCLAATTPIFNLCPGENLTQNTSWGYE